MEVLDRLFRDWKKSQYNGFTDTLYNFINLSSNGMNTNLRAGIDSENGNYLELSSKQIADYNTDRESLFKFYNDYNIHAVKHIPGTKQTVYKMRNYPTTRLAIELWNKYLKTDYKYILEIGFSGGFTTLNALNNTNACVLTLDKFFYQHYWYAKNFIDEKYPGRNLFVQSKMKYATQYLDKYTPDIKFDFISFNKSKKFESVYKYILDFRNYADENTLVYLNGPTANQSWGIGSYMAMNKAINEGILILVEYAKLDDFHFDTGAVLRYNFNENYIQKLPIKQYIIMEEKIPQILFLNYIMKDYDEQLGKVTIDFVNRYIIKFQEFGLKLDDEILKILKIKFNIIPSI